MTQEFYMNEYQKWAASPALSDDAKAELAAIKDDDNEIRERFTKMLAFGTAGLRGIMRQGLNGMNIYMVRLATQGLAELIIEESGGGVKSDCFQRGDNVMGQKNVEEREQGVGLIEGRTAAAGGILPAAVNGANEVAVRAFLDGKIRFLQIGEIVTKVLENTENRPQDSLGAVLDADRAARAFAESEIEKIS